MKNLFVLIFIIFISCLVISCSQSLSREQMLTRNLLRQYPDIEILEIHRNCAVIKQDSSVYFVVTQEKYPNGILLKKKIKFD